MASNLFGSITADEQEGGSDATGTSSEAIDSSVSLIGTRDTEAISNARLRAMGKEEKDTTPEIPIFGGGDIAKQRRRDLLNDLGIDPDEIPDPLTAIKEVKAQSKGLYRGTKLAYEMGNLNMEKGRIGFQMKQRDLSPDEVARMSEIDQRLEAIGEEAKDTPEIAQNFGNLAPWIVNSAIKGGKGAMVGGMVGGTVGAIAGNLIPGMQVLPEEVFTVTGGAALGAKVGATFNSTSDIAEVESGLAYMEMIENGIDKDKAGVTADVIGTGSGLLEIVGFKYLKGLVPSAKKEALDGILTKAANKIMGDSAVGRAAARQLGTAVAESNVEVAQELVSNIGQTAAATYKSELDETDMSPKSVKELGEKLSEGLWDTWYATAQGMLVAGVPAAGGNILRDSISGRRARKVGDGEFIEQPDSDDNVKSSAEKGVNIVDTAPGNRPSVNSLFGVDEDGETRGEEEGVSLSDNLTASPEKAVQARKTGDAIKSTLDNMQLTQSMKRDKIDIENNESKLESISDLYGQAVIAEDYDEALSLAEHYAQTVGDTATKLDNLMNAKAQKMAKQDVALAPEEVNSVQQYKQERFKQSHGMLSSATKAAKAADTQSAMNLTDALESDPKVLKGALVKSEQRNKANSPEIAKQARQVSDMIDSREYMSDDTFLEKVAKPEKLLKLKGDLERTILDMKEDPKVSSSEQAVTQASLKLVDETLAEKQVFDESMSEKKRVDEQRRLNQQKATALAQPDVKRKPEQAEVQKKATTELEKRQVQLRARTPVQKKAEVITKVEKIKAEKKRATKKVVIKPAAAVGEKTKRQAEIKKQQAMAKELGDLDVEPMKVSATQKTKARELFRSAGISVKGKVFEGKTHGDAVFKNKELQDFLNDPKSNLNDLKEGFVQKDGKFVGRATASKMIGTKNIQSEKFIEAMQATRRVGHQVQLEDADMQKIEDIGEVYDVVEKDNKYGWLHTLAKAMGVKTNVVFGKKALDSNQDFAKVAPKIKKQIRSVWDNTMGVADPNTFTNFVNAEKMIGPSKAKAQETVAHETIHGVVRKKLKQLGGRSTELLNDDLQNLWDSISQEAKDKAAKFTTKDGLKPIATGIKQVNESIQELITYAMVSPDFAAWLNTIPSLDKAGVRTKESIWERLVGLIANVINKSKLSDVVNILNSHLDIAQPGALKLAPKAQKATTQKAKKTPGLLAVERMAVDATEAMGEIETLATVKADADYIRTANDGSSALGKIHEWRDKAAMNMDRFTIGLEQELLDTFQEGKLASRVVRALGVGSGRRLNTAESELQQKAMNLYADSSTKMDKVQDYMKELQAKKKLTNREKDQLVIMDRMLNMTEAEKTWVDENIRTYYDEFFEFANKHELIDPDVHLANYVKRQWKMPKQYGDAEVVWNGTGTSGFKLTPSSAKQRSRLPNGELKIDSIVDGWRNGLDLKTEGVIANLSAYGNELGYTFANRKFVEYFRGLIGWDADSLMFEQNTKSTPDFKPPAGYSQVTMRGMAKPFHKLYARNDLATELNKMGKTASKVWDFKGIKGIRRLNSMIKSTILSVSLFHHFAGMRSYVFGVKGKGLKINPITAYKRGLKKIDEKAGFDSPNYQHLGPIVDFLVQEGLTLGAKQDWDEAALQESLISDVLKKGTGKVSHKALKAWEAARRTKRSLTSGLFNRLFAGLKAESGAIELAYSIKKQEKKLGRALTPAELKLTAQQIARLINADFGGLHLGRMGRHPDLQVALQGVLLAPDWTESNWRTVTGMVPGLNKKFDKSFGGTAGPKGMAGVYRKFWGGVLIRGGMASIMANMGVQLLLAAAGDDDAWDDWLEFQKEQWTWKQWFKGKWSGVDVTGVYKMLGIGDPEKRNTISVFGHFKDALKVRHPIELAKHKLAPVPGKALNAITGTDWKGAHFTTWDRMIQDGGLKLVEDSAFKGQKGSVDWLNAGSFMLSSLASTAPIPVSNMADAYFGESLMLSSLLRSAGLDTRDIRRRPAAQADFEEMSEEINELDRNLREARLVKDQKIITKARKDIRDYKGFNTKKSRIGFTKSRIAVENRKLNTINAKIKKGIDLTPREEQKQVEVRKRKQAIYEKAMTVLDR